MLFSKIVVYAASKAVAYSCCYKELAIYHVIFHYETFICNVIVAIYFIKTTGL